MKVDSFVLVVEDDVEASKMLVEYLEFDSFKVASVESALEGLEFLSSHEPDIILLDIMMPDMNGIEMLKQIRLNSDVPVLMLTAKHDDTAKVLGLELGADDYLTKPYNPSELSARIKAILRRTKRDIQRSATLSFSNLTLKKDQREASVSDRAIDLTKTEFNLLEFFASNINQVLSKEELFEKVIGREYEVYDRTLDMHVSNLRKKLAHSKLKITTCRGVGFRMEDIAGD